MNDPHPQQSVEWLDRYSRQYGQPQKDPSVVPRLIRAIADYLQWMKSVDSTSCQPLSLPEPAGAVLGFVKNQRFCWEELFTVKTRDHFKKTCGLSTATALNGLSRHLVEQGRLKRPLPQGPAPKRLADIFEDYLQYRQDGHQTDTRQLNSIRRVLSVLCDYFSKHGITPARLRIEQLDAFMTEYGRSFSPGTRHNYRFIVRGFLSYLYQERGILKKTWRRF